MSIKRMTDTIYEILLDLKDRYDAECEFPEVVQAAYDLYTLLHDEKGYPTLDEMAAMSKDWEFNFPEVNEERERTPFDF